MFYLFPRAVRPDLCEQIVKECKQKTFEEAGVYSYPNDTPYIAKTTRPEEVWVDDPKIRKTAHLCYFSLPRNPQTSLKLDQPVPSVIA